MQDLLHDMTFDFVVSLRECSRVPAEFASARLGFHRNMEVVSQQFVAISLLLSRLKALLQQPDAAVADTTVAPGLKTAILSPDLYPETSECLAKVVISLFEACSLPAPDVLTRRKTFKKTELSFSTLSDWSDPHTLSRYDLVLVACSSSNFPIVQDIVRHQEHLDQTILYPASLGMTGTKAKGLRRRLIA
ncbi:hypothetical protein HDU91_004100 [Kappamyces sp. JEL0680]|nr:hypothetical protein HDU91_004100 [Kappamyces sp. JEL0680]